MHLNALLKLKNWKILTIKGRLKDSHRPLVASCSKGQSPTQDRSQKSKLTPSNVALIGYCYKELSETLHGCCSDPCAKIMR